MQKYVRMFRHIIKPELSLDDGLSTGEMLIDMKMELKSYFHKSRHNRIT